MIPALYEYLMIREIERRRRKPIPEELEYVEMLRE
ncbi:MAG: hypothetical protein PWQ95_674 [Thermococcaceae archaeon]|nr:hypothetical protein [Thermococcaceae archaeon]